MPDSQHTSEAIGHGMGTAEVESALVLHDDVAEAAVVDDLVRNRNGG